MTSQSFYTEVDTAKELGIKAAQARRQGDHARADSHYQYFTRLLNSQAPDPECSKALWDAYTSGYSEEWQSYANTPLAHSGNGTW